MGRIRIIRVAPGEDARAWSTALAGGAWSRSARVLKQDGPLRVARASLLGREVVVKRWGLGAAGRLKAALGASRGERHWRGALWLDRHWFPTAEPLALGQGRDADGPAEWLVMAAVEGRTVLEHLAAGDLPGREQHELAADLGQMVARMTTLGRYNRDHKPSNLIVERLANGRPRLVIIDCVAILPVGRAGGPKRAADRMMASLVIEPAGVGHPVRRALAWRALRARWETETGPPPWLEMDPSERAEVRAERRAWCRAAWGRIAALVRAHGDPTPRVDPLARRAG